MSALYGYFKTGWTYGTVTTEQIDAAVTKGYITAEEATAIKALPQN